MKPPTPPRATAHERDYQYIIVELHGDHSAKMLTVSRAKPCGGLFRKLRKRFETVPVAD